MPRTGTSSVRLLCPVSRYEIVQGFVEHVNAVGLLCAVTTLYCAVRLVEYSAALPEQVAHVYKVQHSRMYSACRAARAVTDAIPERCEECVHSSV